MAKTDPAKVWTLQYRLASRVIADVGPDIEALGLEVKELFTLAALDEAPYPAELASNLCIPKPTMTAYIKRLEAAGFVKREIDAADLRRHRLALTAAGRKVVTQGMEILVQSYGIRMARLQASEQTELKRLLEKMSLAE